MFTGLVQAVGSVASREATERGARIEIAFGEWDHSPALGDSISVSGCCLTVAAAPGEGTFAFDMVPETLARTTLGALAAGSQVNLEHAATPSTLLGGHMVQGHVDGVGEVVELQADPADWRVVFRCPPDVGRFMVPKGSVTVDGVSLTITEVDGGRFGVALIPTTLECTTLDALGVGSRVNIEADIMTKTIVRTLDHIQHSRAGS